MNIVILDDFQDAIRKLPSAALLENHAAKVYTNNVKGVGQLAVRLRDTEVVVLTHQRTNISRALVDKLPKLRLIVQTGVRTDNIDIDACTDHGVLVVKGQAAPQATAELTWALIMAASRRIPHYVGHLKHGAWQQSGLKAKSMPDNFCIGSLLRGKILGIWTDDLSDVHNSIGHVVAGFGRAFGMRVLMWGSEAARSFASQNGLEVATSKASLLDNSDVLTLHPNFGKTQAPLLDLADLSRMKATALLVNTTSASLIDPDALVAALNRGRPGLAAIDVFDTEPASPGQALLRLENCICTPHLGPVEIDSLEQDYALAFAAVNAFVNGEAINELNPQARSVRR
ncbi:MAG: D-2-hydroxyacid dehydrogenase family protein [Burkholderiaceae bacterium]|jgi:D-3-phosphoglycerate dehydrogenase / 2-oxoglutarate reductase|nr:D-2-hydroxyacid dehydrogenase family protein [Burkholderiaceae bacterium]